jgi:NAD(P)-dependent dehydrogenase (short-subunit alcohol dehydrogenase family)
MRAVVTGAARGLGEAVAARLATDGASVALIDVSPEVTVTAERIASAQTAGPVIGIVADVADEAACEAAIAQAAGTLGGIDAVVNNAGVGGPDTRVVDTTFTDFWQVVRVNLGSAFLGSRAAARLMIEQQAGGAIVNIGSLFGQQGVAGGAGYCASKAAVALLTQSLALELAPHGIRVNTIAPGFFRSEITGGLYDDERSAAWLRRNTPLPAEGTARDFTGAILWLASDAGRYVTGQTIRVDGGWTAR